MFQIRDRNQDGFLDLSEIRTYTLGLMGEAFSFWQRSQITEIFLKNQLSEFLGSDNRMDFEEYAKWAPAQAAECFE